MAEDKKGFILYADQIEIFKQLPNDKAGKLIKHIFAYVNDENPITEDLIINLAFTPIKNQFKRDLNKWQKTREGRSKAGKASAEARRNKREQKLTNSTNVDFVQQKPTNPTVNDNVNVNVNVNDNVKDIINNNNYKEICFKDIQWMEIVSMQNKVKYNIVKLFLEQFNDHLVTMEEQKTGIKEYKQHFTHWFKKQDLSNFRKKTIGRSNQI